MIYRIKEKVLSLHGAYRIYDEAGNECYHIKQNAVSIKNKTHLYNMQNDEVALITRKVMSMHAVHYIEMSNGESAELGEKHFIQINDNYEVEGFGWHVQGNIWGRHFLITDNAGELVAESQEKWFSVGDRFTVDIPNQKNVEKVIAVLVTLSLIHRDREAAMSTMGSSSH